MVPTAIGASDIWLIIKAKDDAERALRRVERQLDQLERQHKSLRKQVDASDRSHRRFGSNAGQLTQQLSRMGAKASIAAGPIGALAVAAVGLSSALTPTVGLIAAAPAGLVGMAGAAATGGLAFIGLADAVEKMATAQNGTNAQIKAAKRALAALPAPTREVARQVFNLRDEFRELRNVAASGIMPHVANTLRILDKLFPRVKNTVAGFANAIGDVIARGNALLQSGLFQRNFKTVLQDGIALTRNFGFAGLSLASALTTLGAAASPMTRWLGRLVEVGAKNFDAMMKQKQASGELASFFQRTMDVTKQLGRILRNTIEFFYGLGRAASGMGAGLLDKIEQWTASAAQFAKDGERVRRTVVALATAFLIVKGAMIGFAVSGGNPVGAVIGALAGGMTALGIKTGVLQNALAALWGILQRSLLPWLQRTAESVAQELAPAVSRLVTAWNDNKQAIQDSLPFWKFLAEGAVQGVVKVVGTLINYLALSVKSFGWLFRAVKESIEWLKQFEHSGGKASAKAAQIGDDVGYADSKLKLLNSSAKESAPTLAELSGKFNTVIGSIGRAREALKLEIETAREAARVRVEAAIPALEGYRKKSNLTAATINRNLKQEVAAYTNWAANTQNLLKRGADPKFVEALSKKGPEFVAAYVKGSDKQMVRGGKLWAQRERAKTRVTDSESNVALAIVKAMVRGMNTSTGGLKSIARSIKFASTFQPPKGFSMRDILTTGRPSGATGGFVTPNAIIPKRAAGGIIDRGSGPTADDVLARLSKGEYVVNARATKQNRALLESINKSGLPGFAAGGSVDYNVWAPNARNFSARVQAAMNALGRKVETGIERNFRLLIAGVGNAAIRAFIKSTDRLPYVWGGAGPNSYDCSGLVSAVYGKHSGRGGGRGQRYFTTSSISTAVAGLKSGLGGTLDIGVTSGTGHMAGRYGRGAAGLRFEARGSSSGILIGSAARAPESFSRKFHMARGGMVSQQDARAVAELAKLYDIGGDADKLRVGSRTFDNGGWLMPGTTIATNTTGQPERVSPPGQSGTTINVNIGTVYGANADELANQIQTALKRKKRNNGGIALGLS